MKQVAIVGVGLIGGSIAACLRERKLCERVVGVGRNADRLRLACEAGLIDEAESDLTKGVADADLVVVCTPVETIARLSVEALNASGDGCIVTDGGSTKVNIVDDVRRQVRDKGDNGDRLKRFVGSHPIAGGEKSGFEAARSDLFDGRMVVMTPDTSTGSETVAKTKSFWELLGAETSVMNAAEHDRAMASISHLPHLIAAVLAAATPNQHMPLAAVGWGDTTRVASGDAELWRQIFAQNREPLLESIDTFQKTLDEIRAAITKSDDPSLVQILQEGKDKRDSLGN